MARKYHSAVVENKLKEERTEKCADNNRHKKKKKKSKNSQQQFFKTDRVSDKNLQAGCKDKKELKNLEFKKEVIYDRFQKADIALRKNKKHHSQTNAKQSGSADPRKPSYVYKKRIVDQSKNYDLLCYSNRFNYLPKDHNSVELCSDDDLKKNDQNNRQLNRQKSNDRPEKSVTIVTPLKYDKDSADPRSNSIFLTTQNNAEPEAEQLYDRNLKCHTIKTMIISRGTKYTKSQHCLYTAANDPIENHKMTNNNNCHDKHNWGFYSHNGQNTYSIKNGTLNKNKAETPSRNKHVIENIKPITEPFHKSKYEKSLAYVGSEYMNQEIEKNQILNLDVMDINFGPLSDSTFISTINPQKIQDNDKQNTKVSTSESKMVAQNCSIQNYSKRFNNNSSGFFNEQNQLEEDKYNPRKYYFKCMETINSHYSEENVHLTKKNNLDKNKKKVKYYDDESTENNYSDIKSIQINNLDKFTTYFDNVWEAVMQEISGY